MRVTCNRVAPCKPTDAALTAAIDARRKGPTVARDAIKSIGPNRRGRRRFWTLIGISACLAACTTQPLVGSGSWRTPPEAEIGEDGWVSVETEGDWDDVDAALVIALSRTEMSRTGRTETVGLKRYEVRDALDRRGVIEAADPGGGRLLLRARIGLVPDTDAAGGVLAALAGRLGDLAGKDTAPLD